MSKTDGIHLWLQMWKTTRAIEAHAQCKIRARGLCLSDFGVLEALLHLGPLPVNTLGKKVLLTSGSMTAAVDRLERRGLVERRFTGEDRRARVVRLTEKGSKLIRATFAEHTRDMQQVFCCLNAGEAESMASLLRTLRTEVDRLAGPSPPGNPPDPSTASSSG